MGDAHTINNAYAISIANIEYLYKFIFFKIKRKYSSLVRPRYHPPGRLWVLVGTHELPCFVIILILINILLLCDI